MIVKLLNGYLLYPVNSKENRTSFSDSRGGKTALENGSSALQNSMLGSLEMGN